MNPEVPGENRDMLLEARMVDEVRLWITERSASSESIDRLDYDPDSYPEQRIDTALTGNAETLLLQSNKEAMQTLLGLLGMTFKSESAAKHLVGQFQEAGASGEPKIQSIKRYLDEGKNVGIITPHFVYDDIVRALAAATIALDDQRQIEDNLIVINKAFSFLKFYGMPIAEPTKLLGKIVWFMPEVGAKKYGISKEVISGINRRGIRSYNTELRRGGQLVGYAPTGTGIGRNEDSGEYLFSALPESSVGLMGKLDALVPVTIWQDENSRQFLTQVGEVMDIHEISTRSTRHLLGRQIGSILCGQLADVSGRPVRAA